MALLLPLCSCQLSNKILIGFTAVIKNTAKPPWSSSNSLLHTYPQGEASRNTVDGQRGGSPIPQIKPGAERGEQRPDCDEGQEVPEKWLLSSISQNVKKKQTHTQTTEPPQQAVMTVTSCLLEIQIHALKTSVGSDLSQSLDDNERQVPCPVHPFLASNGLVLQILVSRALHFQVSSFIPFQIGKRVCHSFVRLMITVQML